MEIWKEISGFNGAYYVSNLGNVKSVDRLIVRNDDVSIKTKGKQLIGRPTKNGYLFVNLCIYGHNKNFSIHRLVASYFVENAFLKPEVNHIDGNKLNNNADNLEWCTRQENQRHGFDVGLITPPWTGKFGVENKSSKKVSQLDLNGNVINQFDSITEAAIKTKSHRQAICKCCIGQRTKTNGFRWVYANDNP